MNDPFGRPMENLRVSVTRRCNLACSYCHHEGHESGPDVLPVKDLERIFRTAASLDMTSVKFTGGEPLQREDMEEIVAAASPFFGDVSMTTNGVGLDRRADALAEAGLDRVNISMDTLDPERYRFLTGKDALGEVRAGIMGAKRAGLGPIKINTVLLADAPGNELERILEFCAANSLVLQLIEYVAKREGEKASFFRERHLDLTSTEGWLADRAVSVRTRSMHSRRIYTLEVNGERVEVEMVRPNHNPAFCAACNRLRITSDGKLKPCLLSDEGLVDLLAPLKNRDDGGIEKAFREAMANRRPYFTRPVPVSREGAAAYPEVAR